MRTWTVRGYEIHLDLRGDLGLWEAAVGNSRRRARSRASSEGA